MAHAEFYVKEVVLLRNPAYTLCRSFLYKELEEWYHKHQQLSKKHRSTCRAVAIADVVVVTG